MGKVDTLVLFPIFGEWFQFFNIESNFCCGLIINGLYYVEVSSDQFSHSVMSDSLQPYEPQHARPPCPSTNSWSPPKPMSTELVMPSSHLILCHPFLLLPSIFPSIRVFSNELALHIRWPKYWSLSINISPPNEYPGLISFRMDWLDLLAVQGTKST